MRDETYGILIAPLVTEKGVARAERSTGQLLVFKVKPGSNKNQIREAVEQIFSVKVASVRTARFRGKERRQGRYKGHTPDWKKAYVTIKPGEKTIELFEGV